MKRKSKNGKWKLTAAALSLVGASALVFNLCSEVLAAEVGPVQVVPTTYSVTPTAAESTVAGTAARDVTDEAPEGYQKADYKVERDSLDKTTPTAKALTMEEAAEIGAQMIWDIYGADLDSVTVYMSYFPGSESNPRATWSGDVVMTGKQEPNATRYGFTVDAVTGEWFSVGYTYKLDVDVSVGYDSALAKDCSAYTEKAKQLAEEKNIVHGPVASVEYDGQGYSLNDPEIMLVVTGTNGEEAQMGFSRYDKTLKFISFSPNWEMTKQMIAALEDESNFDYSTATPMPQ